MLVTLFGMTMLSHLVDDAFADLSHVATLIPTREIVIKKQLLFLIPYRTDDVLVHDVRDEELRQPLRVDHLLAGLFHILREICYRLAEHRAVVHRLEVGSSEPFVEVGVLDRRLHLLLDRRIILDLNEFSGHRSVRNVEQPVEVKPLLFGRTLPHTDILPALAVAHHFEASAQLPHKALFGMLCPIIGESAKVVEVLQIHLAREPDAPTYQIPQFPLKLHFHILYRAIFVLKVRLHVANDKLLPCAS